MKNTKTTSILMREKLAAVLVVVLAAVLRLYRLGAESLWIDEGYSLRDAAAAGSLSVVRPLYFKLLHLWIKFGQSESWLRLLAVIFGIGSVALLYMIGRRLYGHKVGLLAALLLAVSPLHVNHSQEVRMYSMTTFLVAAEVLFFIRYVQTGRMRDMVFCLVSAGIAFLVFPLTVIMLLVLDLFFVAVIKSRRAEALRWLAGQGLIALAAIPLIPVILRETRDYGEAWTWRLARPGALDLLRATRDFNVWRIPDQYPSVALMCDVYGVFILGLVIYGAARVHRVARWQTSFVVLWLAVPLIATLVLSHLLANMWLVRYMIYASPAYYLLTALGLAAIPDRRTLGMVAALVLIVPIARLGTYYVRTNRPEWRPAVSYVEQHLSEGDVIALYRYGNRYVFDYYYSGHAPRIALGPSSLSRGAFEGWNERRIAAMMSAIPSHSRRIWFILSYHEATGGFSVENYIRREYHVLETKDFERVKIYLAASDKSLREAGG